MQDFYYLLYWWIIYYFPLYHFSKSIHILKVKSLFKTKLFWQSILNNQNKYLFVLFAYFRNGKLCATKEIYFIVFFYSVAYSFFEINVPSMKNLSFYTLSESARFELNVRVILPIAFQKNFGKLYGCKIETTTV